MQTSSRIAGTERINNLYLHPSVLWTAIPTKLNTVYDTNTEAFQFNLIRKYLLLGDKTLQ